MTSIIYTIGHSNHSIQKFVHLLTYNKIQTLFDVRSVPYSRFAHFNMNKLSETLSHVHVEYCFIGDKLGGRISDPDCYLAGVVPTKKTGIAGLLDYDAVIKRDSFTEGINILIRCAGQSVIALMCSEENPQLCHRRLLIGRRLEELGIRVSHIRGDAAVQVDSGGLFDKNI